VGAGVAEVEVGELGLFGLATGAGAAEDDGGLLWRVSLKEATVFDGFAGGDDAELGGTFCGCGLACGHVLEGVEADDLGHLGKTDAGVARRCGGEGADGSDAGDSREERVAKVLDRVSDGSYATKACNDNTIQVGSF
jgi:hypothetical protein